MEDASATPLREQAAIDGVTIDLVRRGKGKTLLLLQSVDTVKAASPHFELLSREFDVVAPTHPGFGHSEWPHEFRAVDDLAYFYLTLADQLDLRDAALVGCSFGGWVAAEVAIRSTARFSHLVLCDAYGIKVGDRRTRDIADIYAMSQDQITEAAFHDPSKRQRDYSTMAKDDLIGIARSREALAYFGWKPYFHNPGLKRWLKRIDIPTLVLWGESDRIVAPDYGRAYAGLIPGAQFQLIAEAGHYPQLEQPEAFAGAVARFVGASALAQAS